MAVNRRGIVIEIVGDAQSYLRAAETTIGANTKLDSSFRRVGVNAKASADAQIAAAVKASEALRVNALQLSSAATRLPAGTSRDAALVAAAAATDRYNRSIGVSTRESDKFSHASKTVERDVGKATRGLLSGATAGLGFGRSLAFASGGFLAFSGVSRILRGSITGAEQLAKAQDGLAVAIQHTGGNLAKLEPQYAATAKRAQEFGINQADALTGLERATVLTGDAGKAQRAYQEALVISKATGKDFNAVLTATSKGQEGVTTSLRRYGILITAGTSGTKQFQQVFARFAGQARANTSQSERFNATLANSEEIIGTALLPTFNRYLGEFGAWLDKMNKSGRLQKDVNGVLHVAGDVFRTLGHVIGVVDKVTGSFAHTLEILAAFKFASLVTGWAASLETLAAKWGGVTVAATEAQAAEARALTLGNTPTVLPFTVPKKPSVVDRVGAFTGEGAAGAAAAGRTAFATRTGLSRFLAPEALFAAGGAGVEAQGKPFVGSDGFVYLPFNGKNYRGNFVGFKGSGAVTLPGFTRTGRTVNPFPQFALPPGFGSAAGGGGGGGATEPFGAARPIPVFKSFQLTGLEQLAQARASLTRANADDVAAAKGVIARIKRLIARGHLAGTSLIQALQAEASALGTIWSAEDAVAQKRAQRAAAAQARIQKQIQDSIDPINLEVDLSREQATGKSTLATLRALRAAARKAITSGKLSLDQQKQAYDQITSLNQQIKAAQTTATVTFTAPARLQLSLAKDAALGIDQTKDLLKLKAAILKFIRTHKKNIQAEIDAYNQLASVNQQLGQTAQSALGLFKELNTRQLTAGLHLSAADRAKLRARLSQLGPGGTVPGSGTGAFGFAINPQTDRPLVFHNHIHLGDKEIAQSTTRHQQKHRRRNPGQRRGPNAGLAGA